MKNHFVSDDNGLAYKRLSKRSAEKAFNAGYTVLVMTNDRTPITSLTAPKAYTYGLSGIYGNKVETFNDLLHDFTTWLEYDGYGHEPEPYKAHQLLLSYWIKLIL